MCQICGTFTTPNTKMMLYEMCQISKIIQHGYSTVVIQHGYSTVANLQWYGQMLQKFYCFIFPFLSPLCSFFLFSSLSLSSSLSLLPISVPSLFDQSGMFTGSDNGIAPTTTVRFATLDQPRSISPTLSHARSRRSHPEAAVDLTHFPLLSVCLSLCLSLVVGFFFFFFCYNLG